MSTFLIIYLITLLIQLISSFGIDFTLTNEWNLVPNAEGKLERIHKNSIISTIAYFIPYPSSVRYFLYTTDKNDAAQEINWRDPKSLENTNFNGDNPTRILIHGWKNNRNSNMNIVIRNAFFRNGNYNVFVVDWQSNFFTKHYIIARNRVKKVGLDVAEFLRFFILASEISPENLVLIGHSLGAHVAGIAGKNLRDFSKNPFIGQIYGLDPAGPLFSPNMPDERLNASDAKYVEVIHTSSTFGIYEPIGTVDFYPNGGRNQPECGNDVSGSCSHGSAFRYFAESIYSDRGFWGIPCKLYEIEFRKCTRSGEIYLMGEKMKSANTSRAAT